MVLNEDNKIEDARKKKPTINRTEDKDELKEYGCMEEEVVAAT
jgi:hypothetical protein